MIRSVPMLAVFAVALATTGTSIAQPRIGTPSARQCRTLQSLNEKLNDFERRWGAERPPRIDEPPSPRSDYKSAWRYGLKRGMSKDAVRGVLGEPDNVAEFTGGSSSWTYRVPGSFGLVGFDSSGRLQSWSEPR